MNNLLAGIRTLNEILTAGVAITAFSLFLYALTFNLRNRVARSFATIMLFVVVIFTAEALQNESVPAWGVEVLLKVQWLGLVFLPAAYLHLSDALLVTAGRPSRGRRLWGIRFVYVVSLVFLALLALGMLFGDLIANGEPAPYLQRTLWTEVFSLFYSAAMILAWVNFGRAFNQMLTRSGRRRMLYLMAGATAPAIGSYPFLMYGFGVASAHPFLFWGAALTVNIFVGGLIVVMAYAVAFFGVSWPDRLVKSRLFKWILRGPVAASATLGMMTIVRRGGELYDGTPYSALVPFSMVASVLLIEHTITVLSPFWERSVFFGGDRDELVLLQSVEERLLTKSDLRQFLDAVLAGVRDHLQSPLAFIAALDESDLALITMAGNKNLLDLEHFPDVLLVPGIAEGDEHSVFLWGDFWILPLRKRTSEMDKDEISPLLGILGIAKQEEFSLESAENESLWLLAERAALALEDRQLQQHVFQSLVDLQPQAEVLQRWRASGRYDSKVGMLADSAIDEGDLPSLVKDALSHYWGGPKLSDSPLIELEVVQKTAAEHDGNRVNALRTILRRGVESVRPEGDRRFTGEWILYNILELKFIQGQKVRDVAARLAMSEADLYRKQRVAVASVAKKVLELESDAREVE